MQCTVMGTYIHKHRGTKSAAIIHEEAAVLHIVVVDKSIAQTKFELT